MEMHSFAYRLPRYAVDCPVTLCESADRQNPVEARCTSISYEGISVDCAVPFPVGSSLFLSFSCRDIFLVLNTRVAYCSGSRYGLVFLFASDEERDSVGQLVDLLVGTNANH